MLPLETHVLPGWPPVSDPGAGLFWVVLVAIPVTIGLILALFSAAPDLIRKNRAGVMGVEPEDEPTPDTDVAPAVSARAARELAAASAGEPAETVNEAAAEPEAQPVR